MNTVRNDSLVPVKNRLTWNITHLPYLMNTLPEICRILKIKKYIITGSVAMKLLEIPICRYTKDLDILVSKEDFDALRFYLREVKIFSEVNTSEIDASFNNCAYIIRDRIIDFIGVDNFEDIPNIHTSIGYVISPRVLLEKKKQLNRPKDKEDILILEDFCNKLSEDRTKVIRNRHSNLGDIDALAELKKQLEQE